MANSIKYNTGTEASALRTGNFHMGVGDASKGPTSTTGYYSTVNPPPGGYTIYVHNKNIGPSIQIASNDAELIRITNTIASTSYTTINECFQYFYGEVDKMVVDQPMDYVVTDELVLDLNASIIPSYPRSGPYWKSLSGDTIDGVLVNNPDFNSNETFTVNSGGTGSERIDIPKPSQLATDQYLTIEILFKLNTLPTTNYGINTPILGARIGSDYMIFAYPEVNNKSHLGVSYDDSRFMSSHESVFETEVGRWVRFTHVGIPYEQGGYQRGKLMYYINGVLDRDEFISGDSNGWNIPNPFYVGYDARWGVYSDVDVAAIRMYNKQLTAEEISANYYQAPIVTDGLVFAMDPGNLVSFENGDTTAYSLTGSISGSLNNGVTFDSGYGGYWEFDGSDDHIDTPGYNLGAGELTISCWIYKSENAQPNAEGIISKSSPGKREFHLRIEDSPLNGIQLWKSDTGAGAGNVFDTNVPITLNKWQHIVVTMNTTNVEFYLNGENVKSYSGNYTLFYSDAPIRIGGWSEGGGYYFNGKISKVNVYNRALTAEEVMQNYSAGKGRFSA